MNITRLWWMASLAAAGLALALAAGCAGTGGERDQGGPSKDDQAPRPAAKGGAQLWAQSCLRCHNSRPPSWYSDAEWEVSMHHMRIRANLTAEEHKAIVEFLKAGN